MKWIKTLVTLTVLVVGMPGYIAASPSSTIVYDRDLNKGAGPGRMLLVTPRGKILIFKGGIWYLDDNIDLLLVRFINQRYKTDVRVQDFKSIEDILFYILVKRVLSSFVNART